jgi:murein L,D-transpeptidase YcbB/YkuD
MLIRSTLVSRVAAVVLTIFAAVQTTGASAQSPAEDTLRQIIEEGNPAYLDWSTALADRELIGRLYAANGYRLLWSDGEKPSTAAMNGTSSVTVTLKNRIRIFFVYGTALVTEKGDALFFDDIYGHDQRLEAALNSRRPRTVPAISKAPAAEP